eukprot:10190995-Heterocapsa_arctica.AAC.1
MIDCIGRWTTESTTWENKASREKIKQIAMFLATRPIEKVETVKVRSGQDLKGRSFEHYREQ